MTIVTDDLPEVDQAVVDLIFKRLTRMTVELYENPLEYGPAPLANKIVDARTFLDETEEIFMNVSHWFQKYTAAHRSANVGLELGINGLLANDPETRAGRNLEVQKAIASVKLSSEVAEVAKLNAVLDDLKAIISVIKAKRADLKDTQGRIRDLQKLCGELIGLGGRWGSKAPPGSNAPDLSKAPETDKTTLRELQAIFKGEKIPEDQLGEVAPPKAEPEPAKPSGAPFPYRDGGHDLFPLADNDAHGVLDAVLGTGTAAVAKSKDEDVDLTSYPMVGFCGAGECGDAVYNTPSGTACSSGHGGAEVLEEDPNESPVAKPDHGTLDPLSGGNGTSDVQSDGFLDALDADAPKPREKVDLDAILGEFGL